MRTSRWGYRSAKSLSASTVTERRPKEAAPTGKNGIWKARACVSTADFRKALSMSRAR